jgi:hypothetical protein
MNKLLINCIEHDDTNNKYNNNKEVNTKLLNFSHAIDFVFESFINAFFSFPSIYKKNFYIFNMFSLLCYDVLMSTVLMDCLHLHYCTNRICDAVV